MITCSEGGYVARVLADSVNRYGNRLTTMEVTFPRIVLAEFNTHRMFSRNSASSRAIPVERRIKAVVDDPFVPAAFGANKRGMQAVGTEDVDQAVARRLWLEACDSAVCSARLMADSKVHKQWANRLLEPFLWHTALVSATEWDNFFALRCHADAQPEIRSIAMLMRDALRQSEPVAMVRGQWHLPYVGDGEVRTTTLHERIKMSVARSARLSYLAHDAVERDLFRDYALHDDLLARGHMSPFEHQATPTAFEQAGHGNFRGWQQYRKFILGEDVFGEGTRVQPLPEV